MTTPSGRPVGIVTFLFTDIEGSTRLVQHLGAEGWAPLLARHRAIIRTALESHNGIELQTEGDGFFAVFTEPRDALAAVVDAQRALQGEGWPADATIRVRMGIHTGDALLDHEGLYVGHAVHRAARVAAAGNGGQIVLSEATVALVDQALPQGVQLRALGEHRLKDLRPERLWDVVIDGLPAEFPPIRSLDARPNNLPTQLTTFVGREEELAKGRDLLRHTRLLTLTGPGGTGKTRFSLQLAANAMDDFAGGIYFVPCADVTDPRLVPSTIAHSLRIAESPGRPPLDAIADNLAGKKVLLVLDNLEQVVDAAPDLSTLLRSLPQLSMIATSRAVLRISGEQEYPLPGLASPPDLSRLSPMEVERLPEDQRRQDPDDLVRYEAVRLFVSRAGAVRPDFALTPDNAPAIAAICARLDGMPLAIELAAARVRALTPAAILERLGRQLDLLASGSRDVPERQRSLRGAIAWSHDILDEPSHRLFERTAVFVGGFGFDDAEAVGGDDVGVDVLDGLSTLVDQSLIRLDDTAEEPRYQMLEPIRDFALEHLAERGEADAVRDRHAARFLDLAERAAPLLIGSDQRRWLDALERETANLRAAIQHAVASRDARTALRFVAALWRFWQIRGQLLQGYASATVVLAMPETRQFPAERLAALEGAGGLAWWLGDYDRCAAYYDSALELRRAQGDTDAIGQALYNLAFPLMFGSLRFPEVQALLEEAIGLFQSTGNRDGEARAWWAIANVAYLQRQWPEVRPASSRAIEHFRAAGLSWDLAWALYTLGQAEAADGNTDDGMRMLVEALGVFRAADDLAGIVLVVDAIAALANRAGERERAARLSGAVARLERLTGTGLNGRNRVAVGFDPLALRADPSLAAAWADGEAMELATVVDYALGRPIDTPSAPAHEPLEATA